jgi:hypothetical protein
MVGEQFDRPDVNADFDPARAAPPARMARLRPTKNSSRLAAVDEADVERQTG